MAYLIIISTCVSFIVFVIWLENINRMQKRQMEDDLMTLLRQQVDCTNYNQSLVMEMQEQVDAREATAKTLVQALQMADKNVIEAIRERDRKDEYIKSLEEKLKLYIP